MWNRIAFILAVTLGSHCCQAADPKTPARGEASIAELSLEVTALQSLHRFQMTTEQLTALRKLASTTVAKASAPRSGMGTEAHRKALLELRAALLDGKNERIEELEEDLADLLEKEDADFDDQVSIVPAARRKAPEVLQSLRPAQLAAFFNAAADDVPDPLETLLAALEVAGDYKDAEWKELTAEIVDDLGWQLGGLDPERSRFIAVKVEQYLKKIRALSGKELERQRPELERQARQFVAQVAPTVVLHNFAEHSLAELLSNPRLTAALDARLEK